MINYVQTSYNFMPNKPKIHKFTCTYGTYMKINHVLTYKDRYVRNFKNSRIPYITSCQQFWKFRWQILKHTYTYTMGLLKLAQEAMKNPNSSTIFKKLNWQFNFFLKKKQEAWDNFMGKFFQSISNQGIDYSNLI